MKILRQKLFTFQDKKAFLEFYKATRGLRELPKGRRGMKARDVYRFEDLAQKIDAGDLKNINYEEARKALEHVGLPESGKGLKHLVKKYKNINDPEFRKRFNRIYNRDVVENVTKYRKEMSDDNLVDWVNSNFRTIPTKDRKKAFDLLQRSKKKGIVNSLKTETCRQDIKNALKDPINLKATKIIKGKLKRINTPIHIQDENSFYYTPNDPNKKWIAIKKSSFSPAALAHEGGHAMSYERQGLDRYNNNTNGIFSRLAEENMATSRADALYNAAVKRGELPQSIANTGRNELENSFGTYFHNSLKNINGNILNDFRLVRRL